MTEVFHVSGPILTAPREIAAEAWIVGGRMTYTQPAEPASRTLGGWVIPGLVDAHCHLGLAAGGAAGDGETVRQARTDAAAGTLLVRD
ncbi:hypothetical protein [Sinomonas sp. ASV322]|uniref:hypothetical protein n=1 Tax=Sinomonas sp. ASV322 TaxID=3041920 RepID=UPI0035A32762